MEVHHPGVGLQVENVIPAQEEHGGRHGLLREGVFPGQFTGRFPYLPPPIGEKSLLGRRINRRLVVVNPGQLLATPLQKDHVRDRQGKVHHADRVQRGDLAPGKRFLVVHRDQAGPWVHLLHDGRRTLAVKVALVIDADHSFSSSSLWSPHQSLTNTTGHPDIVGAWRRHRPRS